MINRKSVIAPRLFIHLQGGLGNQLFIYFGAEYLRQICKKKIIFISTTSNQLSKIGIARFKNETILLQNANRFFILIFAKISRLRLLKKYIYFSSDVGYEDINEKAESLKFISGYFQSYLYSEESRLKRSVIYENLIASSHNKQLSRGIDFRNSVAIHIRRGDYLLDKNSYFGLLSAEYYREALLKISLVKSYNSVYLFSDSNISVDFKEKLEISTDVKMFDMNECENLDDIFTLALLTKFENCIISNSTFSWWGAYLGDENKVVVAPSKWFKNRFDPSLLHPTNWLRSESKWED
jgi:hypothetical protein